MAGTDKFIDLVMTQVKKENVDHSDLRAHEYVNSLNNVALLQLINRAINAEIGR